MKVILILLAFELLNFAVFVCLQRRLVLRVLALRHQLAVFQRRQKKPRLKNRDRLFWSVFSRLWPDWRSVLVIVRPETVLRWQKKRFRDYWRRKSRPGPGRPRISQRHIDFIKRISGDHPEYGKERIALELEIKFGIKHSRTTVGKYMVRKPGRPRGDQTWRTFLKNQADGIWMCDFFVQHTVRFTALYAFVIMELGSRRIVHWNVTEHPTLAWVKQQMRDATYREQPKFLIHDNDGKYGQFGRPLQIEAGGKKLSCRSALDLWLAETMAITGIPIPYGAPNAQAHVERLIGTLRRESLDKMLIWNERHFRAVLSETVSWYNGTRIHQGIRGIPLPDPEYERPPPGGRETDCNPDSERPTSRLSLRCVDVHVSMPVAGSTTGQVCRR